MTDTALRLADALGIVSVKGPLTVAMHEAAAELRRLHALNAELVEALRGWMNQPEDAATYDACMARAEAALAKAEVSK